MAVSIMNEGQWLDLERPRVEFESFSEVQSWEVVIWFQQLAASFCVCSADDWDSIRVEDHAGGGFVGAGQVVEVFAVGVAACVGHLLILLHAYHQALVTDRLHVILVTVRWLVEGALWQRQRFLFLIYCIYCGWNTPFFFFIQLDSVINILSDIHQNFDWIPQNGK